MITNQKLTQWSLCHSINRPPLLPGQVMQPLSYTISGIRRKFLHYQIMITIRKNKIWMRYTLSCFHPRADYFSQEQNPRTWKYGICLEMETRCRLLTCNSAGKIIRRTIKRKKKVTWSKTLTSAAMDGELPVHVVPQRMEDSLSTFNNDTCGGTSHLIETSLQK